MDFSIRDARILVIVKAYPNPSKAHRETVCTAGLLDGKKWVRVYPIPFRMLDDETQYPKYGWIHLDIERRLQDFRPESHRLLRGEQECIRLETVIQPTPDGWKERKSFVLREVFDSMDVLLGLAKGPEKKSIGVIKPTQIKDVIAEDAERDWAPDTIAMLQAPDLFDPDKNLRQLVKKIPYTFSYIFTTADGKDRKVMIEDWEIGALYWNCLKNAGGNEIVAVDKVKKRLWDYGSTRDMYFIMGTALAYHMISPNPFRIIGLFYPPFDPQLDLFYPSSS
jgi:hypothetical protein